MQLQYQIWADEMFVNIVLNFSAVNASEGKGHQVIQFYKIPLLLRFRAIWFFAISSLRQYSRTSVHCNQSPCHQCTICPLPSIWQHLKLCDCLEVKREYNQNCFIYCQRATSSMGTDNKNSSHSPVGPWICLFVFFLCCMICLYVGICFVLPWSVESFLFMFWRWRSKLKWAPFEFFAPSPLLRVRSWLHPF